MNVIIAASGGQDTNIIPNQKATRQVFFVVWVFLFDFQRRSYRFGFVHEHDAGGLVRGALGEDAVAFAEVEPCLQSLGEVLGLGFGELI